MRKKKRFSRLIAYVILVAMLGSCKYEDGPFISFHSQTHRLKKRREITLLEMYGQDLLPEFNRMFPNSEFSFDVIEANGWASLEWSFKGPNGYVKINGGYNFSPVKEHAHKTYMNLNLMGIDSVSPGRSMYPPLQDVVGWDTIAMFKSVLFPEYHPTLGMVGPYPHYEITKLTNKELHLLSSCYQCDLGYTYRIHFKNIDFRVP